MIRNPPEILEQIAESPAGRIHRARLEDGREVAAVQVVLADATSVEAATDRLRRVAGITDPALSPVLGWWIDGTSAWYLTELDEGLPFSRFPSNVVLSPQQAVALSLGILQGLAALHEQGLSHGALSAANVRVDDRGRVRLAGHPLAILRFPSDAELVAEVRSAGRLVCDAFGIPVEKSSGPPRAIEHAAPALVVAARSIANGTRGSDLKGAAAGLRDTAGPLANPERLALGVEELGALVGGREPDRSAAPLRGLPAIDPAPTVAPVPSAPAAAAVPVAAQPRAPLPPAPHAARVRVPPADSFDDSPGVGRRLAVIGVIALVLVLLVGGGVLGVRALLGAAPQPVATTPTPQPSPTRAVSPSPSGPQAVPVFAPSSAGSVRGVAAKTDGPCAVGSTCTLEVQVMFQPESSSHDVNWTFKVFDRCTGSTADQPGGTVTARAGWNLTSADTTFTLPAARGQLAIVAISTSPDRAASQPVLVGPEGC